MEEVNTRQGVVIDHCPACKGVWLDEGEIYLFSQDPKWLHQTLATGLASPHASTAKCPRCNVPMEEGKVGSSDLTLDLCPACKGLWFDDGELKTALELGKKFRLQIARDTRGNYSANQEENRRRWQESLPAKERKLSALKAGIIGLPSLALRSAFSFLLLYGLLFLALIVVGEALRWPLHFPVIIAAATLFLQYLIGPWILDLSLSWFYQSRRVGLDGLPQHLREFIQRVCREKKMKIPRMIVIEDNAPNAFTYGRTPNDARVVITRGILTYLEPEEVEAVVGHELGHARHWDILVMVLAAMVPVIMYYLYRLCMQAAKSKGDGKGSGPVLLIGLGAYAVYIVTEYIVLGLSRTREYWADRFAGEVTQNPNALSRALVKIAYGLIDSQSEKAKSRKTESEQRRASNLAALNVFGIFDMRMAKSLALNSYTTKRSDKPCEGSEAEKITAAMQWDLWNPWASYYEIHSTHPLPAKRIDALCDQAAALGKEPYIVFNRRKPESYWDEFLIDVLVHFLPLYPLLAAAGLAVAGFADMKLLGALTAIGLGICLWAKIALSYPSALFPSMKVSSLLGKIKVSEVRPVPVTLEGKIIGRGVPGYVFSEDVVIQDETGIIFLDYRQPLKIVEFFFALFRTGQFVGKEVVVQGWYRRAPTPYVEVKSLRVGNKDHRCYVYHFKIALAILIIAAGIFWLIV